jgi:exonuclease-1
MGITGLLPVLKSLLDPIHISQYKGQRVGIDSYSWLHRGMYSCAQELILKPNSTSKHIDWCWGRIELLLKYEIIPVMVFDGDNLPAKARTELSRRSHRDKAKAEAIVALNNGDSAVAYKLFQRACDVTGEMAKLLIDRCTARGIECIVAPYEARLNDIFTREFIVIRR